MRLSRLAVSREAREVLVISLGGDNEVSLVNANGHPVLLRTEPYSGDPETASALVGQYDGRVAAIALDGLPATLHLSEARRAHRVGQAIRASAAHTPVVDGSNIRADLEQWGISLAADQQPGLFSSKHVLMCPGLNHVGLARALEQRGSELRYADPFVFFGLPHLPGVGRRYSLEAAAAPTLEALLDTPFEKLRPDPDGATGKQHEHLFDWAEIIAGDVGTIRRFAPPSLHGKTVVVEYASEVDIEDLGKRGVDLLVTVMPSLHLERTLASHSAAVVEAALVATRPDPDTPLTADCYLNLASTLSWQPGIAQPATNRASVNRFAFVIHPLAVGFIRKHRLFRWTRFLPESLVEWCAAYMPPLYLSRITGARSPETGQRVEGYLYALGATPRQMLAHRASFTYRRLNRVARLAERKGARILGLGAFTSVVGDAGITVARESNIPITSGNSLTVSATLEAAKQALIGMGVDDLGKGRAMIVGATGSIGAICARLIALAIRDVVLISVERDKLIELKLQIENETPGSEVVIGTRTHEHLPVCDLVVTATSAFGQRVVDISRCKPGAVVCDVARPHDISAQEAAVRPDVLVIDSGEVLIPGEIDFGYDIGLPPKVSYACLAETALLTMEGLFVDYTVGRNLKVDKVKQIHRLFKKHGFKIAGLRSFDEPVTEAQIADKRRLADGLREDPGLLARTMTEAGRRLEAIPMAAKGVRAEKRRAPGFLSGWLVALLKRAGGLTGSK